MKICQTVFPQTSGYLKYRPKEGEGGGGALIGRMALNRGGALVDLLFLIPLQLKLKKKKRKICYSPSCPIGDKTLVYTGPVNDTSSSKICR